MIMFEMIKRKKYIAMAAGVIGGCGFFIFYLLGQRPPNYITPLNPLGMLIFILVIGAIGAFLTGEWSKATQAARYGALSGAVVGVIISLTLLILHNYAKYIQDTSINFSALLRDLPYYILMGGILSTLIIAAVTLVMGAAGAFAFSCIAQFVDTIMQFKQHRR